MITILCLHASPGLRIFPLYPLSLLSNMVIWPGSYQDYQIKKTPFQVSLYKPKEIRLAKKSLLRGTEYGRLSANRNFLMEILRISFFCGWDVKLSIGWSEKVEPQGDFPPAVLPSQASTFDPSWEMLSFLQQLTVTEVKLVFPHIAC